MLRINIIFLYFSFLIEFGENQNYGTSHALFFIPLWLPCILAPSSRLTIFFFLNIQYLCTTLRVKSVLHPRITATTTTILYIWIFTSYLKTRKIKQFETNRKKLPCSVTGYRFLHKWTRQTGLWYYWKFHPNDAKVRKIIVVENWIQQRCFFPMRCK